MRLAPAMFLMAFFVSSCHHKTVPMGPVRMKNLQEEACFFRGSDTVFENPLTLDDIIKIAIANNLDLMVKAQEVAINAEVSNQEHLKMIPNGGANYRYTERDHNTAAFSQSLVPGVPPAPLSISRNRFINTWSVEFSWTLLDFGMAYFQWHQEANKTLIKRIQYQRLEQDLILNIVQQYWKAVAARKAFEGAKEVLSRVYSQKELYRRKMGLRIISDLVGLSAENRLVDIELDFVRFERLYHQALLELAQSMGIPPAPDFEIVIPEIAFEDIEVADIETLEQTALIHRPELYEKDVEDFIALDELNIAALEMFPNLRLFSGSHHDSNFFLLFNTWYEIGLQTAWDLLSLPWRYKHRDIVLEQRELVRKQRFAMALGVLTQVNLANLMLKDYIREYKVAREAYQVKSELAEAYKKRQAKGIYSEAETLIYDSDAYFAGIRLLESYAQIQSSIEQLNNAMGLPLYYGADKLEEAEICMDCY